MRKTFLFLLIPLLMSTCFTTACANLKDNPAQEKFDKAMILFFQGVSIPAMNMLKENIAEHPEHVESYSALAMGIAMGSIDPFYTGSRQEALDWIAKARKIGPDNQWNHIALLLLHLVDYTKGDLPAIRKAEKEGQLARKVDPAAGESAFLLWALNKFFFGDRKAADKYYAETIGKGMKYTNPHYLIFFTESFFGSCDSAVPEALIGFKQDPANKSVMFTCDGSKISETDYATANCHYWKGLKYQKMGGSSEDIEKELRTAIGLCPNFDWAKRFLVQELEKTGRTEEAKKLSDEISE